MFLNRGSRRYGLALLLVMVLLLPTATTLAAGINFANDNFKQKWERADKGVADGKTNPARSWLWGPEGFNPPSGDTEPYAESPGGRRQVQYFDKARMELNNPANGLVTNGLLVRELISGRLATGDTAYTQRQAANDIPVAGDAVNNNGPTYASFANVASLNLDHPSTDRTGQTDSETIDKAGTVANDPSLVGKVKYAYFEGTLKHNIPDVFWTFMNQSGNVYENGQYGDNKPVLGTNPAAPWLDATGFPISEAYWSKVTVGGQVKDVLIQNFERRVLTYTPTNPVAFQVEMGNVGRHYYTWRYTAKYDLAPAQPSNPTPSGPVVNSCKDLPADPKEVSTPLRCGPAGMEVVSFIDGLTPSESIDLQVVNKDGTTRTIGTETADKGGSFASSIATSPRSDQGFRTFRAVGKTSGKKIDFYVWLDAPRTSPTILGTTSGYSIDLFAFAILGFDPNEEIFYSIKNPKGKEFTTKNVKVTEGGGLTIILLPALNFGSDDIPGEWTIAAVSARDGKRFAGIKFTIKS